MSHDTNTGKDDEGSASSTSSASSLEDTKSCTDLKQDDGILPKFSNPVIFSWGPPEIKSSSNSEQSLVNEECTNTRNDEVNGKLVTQESTTDSWVLGGSLGSRSASLVFKSSALANSTDLLIKEKPGYKLHITYKVLQAETKLLSKLLECHGVTEVATNSSDFNLLWTGSHPKPGALKSLAPYQRVNHFPRSYELTRKDRLYKNIERMQHSVGFRHFDFIPQTFIMPMEFGELCSAHHRTKGPWIIKPVASSRGRGIFIVETPNKVPLDEPVVVAKYISRPLLVAGHKCDLRLYVAVTMMDPLIIYIYEEGLVRFATVKYDASHKQLWNPCMHLCNYSINKYHSDYVKSDDPSEENVGHKWTLSALLRHLKGEGKNTIALMSQVEDVIIKAILACSSSIISACRMFVPHQHNCFELYGFDILIDEKLKPWLLEVNLSPSLGCDSPLDVRLKSAMLADLLTLVGIPAVDPLVKQTKSTLLTKSNSKLNRKDDNSLKKLNTHSHKSGFSAEEIKILRFAKSQFQRRGGFVRIFPAADSWAKYSQYLDPTTGIPINGSNSSISNYNLAQNSHNLNFFLHSQLFPDEIYGKLDKQNKYGVNKIDRRRPSSAVENRYTSPLLNNIGTRQDRYERKLSQGHRTLLPRKVPKDNRSIELRKQIVELLKNGKKLTQVEIRKTFSHYLACVLKRISENPQQEQHLEIVFKFLQKASNYLRTPHPVKVPREMLETKDRAALVARMLHDFLCLYNRETELYVEKNDNTNQLPSKLFSEFLNHARECDLEEILILQTTQPVPTHGKATGFQGVIKCISNVPKNVALGKNVTKSKSMKIPSLS